MLGVLENVVARVDAVGAPTFVGGGDGAEAQGSAREEAVGADAKGIGDGHDTFQGVSRKGESARGDEIGEVAGPFCISEQIPSLDHVAKLPLVIFPSTSLKRLC